MTMRTPMQVSNLEANEADKCRSLIRRMCNVRMNLFIPNLIRPNNDATFVVV